MQAGPEILIMAMAARPGALDKAKIVGSSFVETEKARFRSLPGNGQALEQLVLFPSHDCLTMVDLAR